MLPKAAAQHLRSDDDVSRVQCGLMMHQKTASHTELCCPPPRRSKTVRKARDSHKMWLKDEKELSLDR